jgi:hypothetical protein
MSNTEKKPVAETTGYWGLVHKAYEDKVITKEELRAILLQPQSEGGVLEEKKVQRVATIRPWKKG